MVQRFLAILLILAGLGGIGYGVATATVLRESDTVVATATPSGDGTLVVTEPGVLGLVDDQVTVRATVPEGQKVTLALGSDVDVLGWVGADPYDSVTGLSSWETLSVVPGAAPAEAADDGEAPAGKPGTGADPTGSDMWLSEVSGETAVSMRWTEEPGRVVLLAAGVGKKAQAPTLELTWPRPASTPYLWPGVLGGGFALVLGVFMALGARRSRKGGGKRSPSAVRTRQPDSDLPRRDAVFTVDGAESNPVRSAAGFPAALGDPTGGGTAGYPPASPRRPGPGAPKPVAPEPEQERTQAWSPPAPFGGSAPITPPQTPVPAPAPTPAPAAEPSPAPMAAPAASVRGIRRSRRAQSTAAAPAQTSADASAAAQADPAAPDRPMTRRELRMHEQAQRRAATGTMPAVPAPEPEPEPEGEQTPSSRAAAWRQTWGVTGDGDDNR